jgi:hypothetical protein
MHRVVMLALALVLGSLGCARDASAHSWSWRPGPAYALDSVPRVVPPEGSAPACPKDDLVTYRGSAIRYHAPVTVHAALIERLDRFENVAREVAIEVYGRPPATLHHGGAFACRTTKSGRYLSEHALGNALDVEGFSFAAVSKSQSAPEPRTHGSFRIRVSDAWREDGPAHAKRFFALLLERLREKEDVFRAIIGPPDPSHTGHLHFDVGLWAYSRFEEPIRERR